MNTKGTKRNEILKSRKETDERRALPWVRLCANLDSPVAQMMKSLPTMRETWVRSLGPLEKEMAIHSCNLVCKIPRMKEPNRLQSTGLQRVGHNFLSCANWWCQDSWGILCWSLSCPYLSFVLSMNGSTTAKIESKLPSKPPPPNALSHRREGGGGEREKERNSSGQLPWLSVCSRNSSDNNKMKSHKSISVRVPQENVCGPRRKFTCDSPLVRIFRWFVTLFDFLLIEWIFSLDNLSLSDSSSSFFLYFRTEMEEGNNIFEHMRYRKCVFHPKYLRIIFIFEIKLWVLAHACCSSPPLTFRNHPRTWAPQSPTAFTSHIREIPDTGGKTKLFSLFLDNMLVIWDLQNEASRPNGKTTAANMRPHIHPKIVSTSWEI